MSPTVHVQPTLTTPATLLPSLAASAAVDRYRAQGSRLPVGSLPPETFPESAFEARAEAAALEAFGVALPCQRPIRFRRHHVDGSVEEVRVRCGTRRARACPSCAALYRGDAKRILRAGLAQMAEEGETLVFVTATAPSFGRVHHVPKGPPPRLGAGQRKRWAAASRSRCGCGQVHSQADEGLRGVPIDVTAYSYAAQTHWNRSFGRLWSRTMDDLGRAVGGRVAYACVVEHSARGAVHAHALLRLPAGFDVEAYRDKIRGERSRAVEHVFESAHTTEDDVRIAWGSQVMADVIADDVAVRRTAGYVSKLLGYVAKDLGTDGAGRAWSPSRSAHQDRLDAVAETLPCSEACAERLESTGSCCDGRAHRERGFRGFVMRRARSWSGVTLTGLREARRLHVAGPRPIGPLAFWFELAGVDRLPGWQVQRARDARLLDHADALEDLAVAEAFGGMVLVT